MYESPGKVMHSLPPGQRATLVIRNIGKLITMAKEGPGPMTRDDMESIEVIENAAVAVSGEIIVFAGPETELASEVEITPDTYVLDAKGRCVIPGFVDPHTHLIFAGSREFELEMKLRGMSYMDILQSGGGILHTVKETRKATNKDLFWQAWERLDTMLLHGTTTAEAKSGYGLTMKDELRCLDVIHELNRSHYIDLVPTFLGAHALPPEFSSTEGYIEHIIKDMLPAIANSKKATYCDVFCDKGVFSADEARALLKAAREQGMGLKIHADEIENIGAVRVAADLGAASADHLVKTTNEDIEAMIKAGVIGILLPATTYALMSKNYARARDMIDMGLPVALATDLNPNCYTESMQFVISLGCYRMGMRPEEALAASTINAAWSIGMEARAGSIELGKRADVLVLKARDFTTVPYHFGVNSVDSVIKAGDVVVYDGKLLT